MDTTVSVFDFERAGIFIHDREPHVQGVFRYQLSDLFRPFHQAEVPAEKIFFVSEIESLLYRTDPVEIEW